MAVTVPGFSKHVLDITLPAAADLSANQFFFVTLNSSGQAALATSLGERVIGVNQDDPLSGEGALVRVEGITKVVLGGTVTVDDRLTTDADAKAVTAAGSENVAGTALSDGVTGDIIPMLVRDIGPLT